MQSKDIKIGEDYAYQAWSRHSASERVTVTGVNTTYREPNRWGGRPTVHTGVVTFTYATGEAKGTEGFCKPAKIIRPWSAEHAERVAVGKARAAAERDRQHTRQQRAEQAFKMHQALIAAGAKVGISYTYDDEDYAALVAAGFEPVDSGEHFLRAHVHSAVNDLSDLMAEGTVHLDQAAVLLGIAEPPRPEDSLDDYDLDEED